MVKTKEKLENLDEGLHGSIDFDVVDISEGQLIRLKDGTILDPEIFVSYFSELSAFEEEFGLLHEAREKLREVKKLEEEFGPVSELSEALNKLYERAEALLESHDYLDDDDEEDDYEGLDDEDYEEEEYDVSDLTVKQLLALLVAALMDEDDGADEDVDLEDLDLERIGDMTVGDLLQLLREGRAKEVSESSQKDGCGCGDKKKGSGNNKQDLDEVVEKLFEGTEGDGEGLPGQPVLGVVEEPNIDREEEEKEEEEDQEDGEGHGESGAEEEHDQAVQVKTEGFDLDLFKRLLDRLG